VRVRVRVRPSWEQRDAVWSWTGDSRRRGTGLRELNPPGPFSDEAIVECEREREKKERTREEGTRSKRRG
jgi:hypothetical protein